MNFPVADFEKSADAPVLQSDPREQAALPQPLTESRITSRRVVQDFRQREQNCFEDLSFHVRSRTERAATCGPNAPLRLATPSRTPNWSEASRYGELGPGSRASSQTWKGRAPLKQRFAAKRTV